MACLNAVVGSRGTAYRRGGGIGYSPPRHLFIALLILFLVCALYAEDEPVHDCRIRSVDFKATTRGENLILRAIYKGYDGSQLSPALCPDQNPPTWGSDEALTFLDRLGYVAVMEGRTGEVRTISIATFQNPDRTFYRERRIRF